MEIILKEDVVNLGYKNDIVTVKSGYGRNYLIPTGKAVIASPSAKKMLAEELKIVPVELTFVEIVNDTPSNLAATASASFLIFSSL